MAEHRPFEKPPYTPPRRVVESQGLLGQMPDPCAQMQRDLRNAIRSRDDSGSAGCWLAVMILLGLGVGAYFMFRDSTHAGTGDRPVQQPTDPANRTAPGANDEPAAQSGRSGRRFYRIAVTPIRPARGAWISISYQFGGLGDAATAELTVRFGADGEPCTLHLSARRPSAQVVVPMNATKILIRDVTHRTDSLEIMVVE